MGKREVLGQGHQSQIHNQDVSALSDGAEKPGKGEGTESMTLGGKVDVFLKIKA